MALAVAAMAGAAANTAAGAGAGEGPSAAPSNGSLFRHNGNFIGVQWTNGDATASTRIYYTDTVTLCPTTFPDDVEPSKGTASPGATTFDTDDIDDIEQCSYYIVHIKDGIFSDFVQVLDKLDMGLCISC